MYKALWGIEERTHPILSDPDQIADPVRSNWMGGKKSKIKVYDLILKRYVICLG